MKKQYPIYLLHFALLITLLLGGCKSVSKTLEDPVSAAVEQQNNTLFLHQATHQYPKLGNLGPIVRVEIKIDSELWLKIDEAMFSSSPRPLNHQWTKAAHFRLEQTSANEFTVKDAARLASYGLSALSAQLTNTLGEGNQQTTVLTLSATGIEKNQATMKQVFSSTR
jgi:hypothetical protein